MGEGLAALHHAAMEHAAAGLGTQTCQEPKLPLPTQIARLKTHTNVSMRGGRVRGSAGIVAVLAIT